MTDQLKLDSEQGKQAVEALMSKMTPTQQEEFKKSLNGDTPVHVHVDKDGNVLLGGVADNATESETPTPKAPVVVKKEEPRRVTRLEAKRQQIFHDRLKRHMGKGLNQEQAIKAIQREDFDALPADKKIIRLESLISHSLQSFAHDIMSINQSHMAIADAFDINYRAIQKMFQKVGITDDQQREFIAEAQKEVIELRKKEMEARAAAQKAAQKVKEDAEEKGNIEAELSVPESSESTEPLVPEGATTFGG